MSAGLPSLLLLLAQMTLLVFLLRLSRSSPPLYSPPTAVLLSEVAKLLFCCFYLPYSTSEPLPALLKEHVLGSPRILLKLCVPSLLYCVQNQLLFAALTHLPAGTYQALYQLKILTTALFSVAFLARKLSRKQCLSLLSLTLGAALCQLSGSEEASGGAGDKTAGIACVLAASCTSGFAGVYFELMLKAKGTSLWVRNLQLALPSVAFAGLSALGSEDVRTYGFFYGYSPVVWVVILLQSLGGFLVAMVVARHSNLAKVITASLSVVSSSFVGWLFLGFQPDLQFAAGAAVVVGSAAVYAANPYRETAKDTELPSVKAPLVGGGEEGKQER